MKVKRDDRRFFRVSRQFQLLWSALKQQQHPWFKWPRLENFGTHNSYVPAVLHYAPGKRLVILFPRSSNRNGYPAKTFAMLERLKLPYIILNPKLSELEMLWEIKKETERLRHELKKLNQQIPPKEQENTTRAD